MIFRSFAKRSQGSLSISLITRFPCLFRRKYPSENAGKGISECLGFKIFWGSMPPDPPRGLRLRRSSAQTSTFAIQPATQKLIESPAESNSTCNIYIMVANLQVIQNTEDNKSFLWHKQLNNNITTVSQIQVSTYVNPGKLGSNHSRILCCVLLFGGNQCFYMFQDRKESMNQFSIFHATCSRNIFTDASFLSFLTEVHQGTCTNQRLEVCIPLVYTELWNAHVRFFLQFQFTTISPQVVRKSVKSSTTTHSTTHIDFPIFCSFA